MEIVMECSHIYTSVMHLPLLKARSDKVFYVYIYMYNHIFNWFSNDNE